MSDFSITALELYSNNHGDLKGILSKTLHYNYLMENGFEKDIDYCLEINKSNLIAGYQDGAIKKLKEEKNEQ